MQGYSPDEEVRQNYRILATLELISIFLVFPILLRQNQGMLC